MKKALFTAGLLVFFAMLQAQETSAIKRAEILVKHTDSLKHHVDRSFLQSVKMIEGSDSTQMKKQLLRAVETYSDQLDYVFIREINRFKKEMQLNGEEEETDDIGFLFKIRLPRRKSKREPADSTESGHKKNVSRSKLFLVSQLSFYGMRPEAGFVEGGELNYWQTDGIDLGFNLNIPLDKKGKINLFTGLGFAWEKFVMTNGDYFVAHDDSLFIKKFDTGLQKSKLRTAWLRVPLGLQVKWGKVILGLEGNVRTYLSGVQKLKYKNEYAQYKVKEKRRFNQSDWICGGRFYIGTGGFRLFFGMDFVPYFKNDDSRMISFGIAF